MKIKKVFLALAAAAVSAAAFGGGAQSLSPAEALLPMPQTAQAKAPANPVYLSVPDLSISSPIIPVGLDADGNMDVPDGKSASVGWYAAGTRPGSMGSAVLDAHVYAAFKNLYRARAGTDLYVTMDDGSTLHYVVEERATYALKDVPAQKLFNRAGGPWLNLITCAGTYSRSAGTYSQRLVLYARLAQ